MIFPGSRRRHAVLQPLAEPYFMRIAFGSPYRTRQNYGGYKRDHRRGGGLWMRLLIAGGIALFAFISYYAATNRNPVTGEEQRVAGITDEQEVAMGYQAAPEMARQMGGVVPPTSPKAQLVEEVGMRLVNAPIGDDGQSLMQILEKEGVAWKFSFTLLENDNTVNAFALPGGPVFITEALFDRFENEAQLAGVLGHEVGHVIHRHGLQRIAKSQLGQQLISAVAVGAGGQDGGYSAAQIAGLVNQMFQMKYGREDELESDKQGLAMMVSSSYDPREMVRVMEILKEASGGAGGGPEFMSTHPHPENRIEGIRQFVEEQFPNGVPDNLTKGRTLR
jgi:predicted Zn-dependent protease